MLDDIAHLCHCQSELARHMTPLLSAADGRCAFISGGTLEMESGGIHLVQYATIEGLLRLGDVELV